MKKTTKVLLATHIKPVIHGQAFMAHQLADLARSWSDIEFLTLNTAYVDKREDLGSRGILKIIKFLNYKKKIIQKIRREKISTVILTPSFFINAFIKDALIIRSLKRKTNAKIIAWIHMDPSRLELEERSNRFKKFTHTTLNTVDLWVACAPSLLESWPKWIPGNKVAIPNGIPDQQTKNDLLRSEVRDTFCVGYLSAMDPEKGWRDLFQVAIQICSQIENIQFHFYGGVGQRETREGIEKVFRESGYSDRILWHGSVAGREKVKAYQSMDLFVFPSHTEQFPITILEAMSYGLPIVSTDVGAVRDALPDQNLLKPRDIHALEKEILKLKANCECRNKYARSNRELFQKKFLCQKVADLWYTRLKTKIK